MLGLEARCADARLLALPPHPVGECGGGGKALRQAWGLRSGTAWHTRAPPTPTRPHTHTRHPHPRPHKHMRHPHPHPHTHTRHPHRLAHSRATHTHTPTHTHARTCVMAFMAMAVPSTLVLSISTQLATLPAIRDASLRLSPALLTSTSTPPASGQRLATMRGRVATCSRARVCVRVCACARVHARACVRVRAGGRVRTRPCVRVCACMVIQACIHTGAEDHQQGSAKHWGGQEAVAMVGTAYSHVCVCVCVCASVCECVCVCVPLQVGGRAAHLRVLGDVAHDRQEVGGRDLELLHVRLQGLQLLLAPRHRHHAHACERFRKVQANSLGRPFGLRCSLTA